ncbi:SGNH/GDSL hydrolase family protein [Nocardiopsis sp. CNT-189]|uniref:SGNH/GDSL hydrolase family protein n=1 Tax=Nocardiopsis oceanisediminis TaxID=2816862 RepID=UPI003B29A556
MSLESPDAPSASEPPARPGSRAALRIAAATAAFGLAGVLASAPAAAEEADPADRYVALGDSFTAGPFIPVTSGDPLLCLRSTNNYPQRVAEALGAADFTDASCSGAVTEHMTERQDLSLGQSNAPQFDALTPDTTLVTVGIGGNDLGFGEVVLRCAEESVTDPGGDPCRRHYEQDDGSDELAGRIPETGEKVAAVLEGIRERSPRATVVVVGYLQLLPEKKGCWPVVPVAEGDVGYLDSVQSALNAELEARAAEAGAVFADVFERGRDMCAPASEKWVEGIFPTRPAAPVHPNRSGMDEVGDRVLEALGVREHSPQA